jgi:Peptidase family C25/CARDB
MQSMNKQIMKKIFTLLMVLCAINTFAQTYNNEWIDFSKTYYKFKIAKTGLCRLPVAALATVNLDTVPAQRFKLYRNGKEVAIYTSVATGLLPANGYIEFWGEANDGKPDRPLYLKPTSQHTDKLSLFTDSASYFITANYTGSNLRITETPNDVAGNSLPVEPYFMHKHGEYFRDILNPGFAGVVGQAYVYSSAFERGEFWSTNEIGKNGTRTVTINDLNLYSSGPTPFLRFGAFGNALYTRHVKAQVEGTVVKDTVMDYFNEVNSTTPFAIGSFTSTSNANIIFTNVADSAQDRMVLSYMELTYPRTFNFSNKSNFEFELPPSNNGFYLEIKQFNYGSLAPVLYDLTYNERYTGDISTPGTIKFAISSGTGTRKMVLVSEEAANITNVANFKKRNFINYSIAANQADYLIISNSKFYTGTSGNNPVDDYRAYRASTNGGNYNAKVFDVNELTDQFAFGIKTHPSSIKNFLSYARVKFGVQPKNVLLIGKGVSYFDMKSYANHPLADELDLIPTFGWPGSDNMLSAQGVTNPIVATPIGRLSVVKAVEIENYLEKLKEYETVQRTAGNKLADRLWMKNILEVTGASDVALGTALCNYMQAYKQILEDTLAGAHVEVLCKNTVASSGNDVSNQKIKTLFEDGLSLVTYFGHSSSTNLDFNLDNPENYNNQGKYPIFSVNGCNAGNFFVFDAQRFTFSETLSEKYTLAKQRGGIAFIASTHFGVVNYLNIYISNLNQGFGKRSYGKQLGEIIKNSLQDMVNAVGANDYYGRLHAEEITLHGDPAIKFNFNALPDYVIEEPQVQITPQFISIAEQNARLNVLMYNMGRATKDSINIEIKRQYPDGSTGILLKKKIRGIYYSDSISFIIPIVATRDKGANKIIVTLDADNAVAESSESNNTVTKEFFVFEDEAKPVFPYNYSIVSKQAQKLFASTANPFSTQKQYQFEIDTTELFNSPFKKSKTITSVGGLIEFDPQVSYTDSTVYYWRVALVPSGTDPYRWNNSSFIYMNGTREGYNQSHYYQHLNSNLNRISLDASKTWKFGNVSSSVFIRNGFWVTAAIEETAVSVSVNGNRVSNNACAFGSLVFHVFNPITFKPWVNTTNSTTNEGLYGSWANNCSYGRDNNFEFRYTDINWRKKIINFMDNVIPAGYYVIIRSFPLDSTTFPGYYPPTFVQDWKKDTTMLGSGNSLYHKFIYEGFPEIDSFDSQRTFSLIYKKGNQASFTPKFVFSTGIYDNTILLADCVTPDTLGYITSPVFGPAKAWKQLQWTGTSTETISTDNAKLDIIGIDTLGAETVIKTIDKSVSTDDISAIDAKTYPNLKLKLTSVDSINLTPYQLKYWRLDYTPVPEGAVSPNIYFAFKDSLEAGELLNVGVVFKNVSLVNFDSIKIKLVITDNKNVSKTIILPRGKKLISGDTLKFTVPVDTKTLNGLNRLFVDFNTDNDQPEQHHFNNFFYKDFYVKGDNINPLLDVTFDGVHILNRDIVSSKPHIQIKVKDEAKYLLLSDTSVITTLQVRFPDANKTVRTYKFNTDTLRFTPAQNSSDNTATIDFAPYFPTIKDANGEPLNPEGDEYELVVSAKDKSGNSAGQLEYRVGFTVIDKPMISNLLNYPNPFTTSTAFVFTLTGSEIPTNFKIQILTVTGKVVREITRDELGPLRIGRNITEYKWDGTDQYGQRLGNGVYLYRVVSTLNGKKMDKYKAAGDNTDKFFKAGYGKMYLMK